MSKTESYLIGDRSSHLQGRAMNNLHSFLLGKFIAAEAHGLTRTILADRIGVSTRQVGTWLDAPSNLRIGTVALLLAGLCGEEIDGFRSSPISPAA